MPIPLVIINSFNVLFSVLVFLLLSFFRFFFITAFYRSSPHFRYEHFGRSPLSFPSPCTASSQAFSVNVFR